MISVFRILWSVMGKMTVRTTVMKKRNAQVWRLSDIAILFELSRVLLKLHFFVMLGNNSIL